MNREEKFRGFENSAESLSIAIKLTMPQVRDILEGEEGLPEGIPSREVAAALAFRHIEEKLDEVNDAAKRVLKAIYKDK